MIVGNFVYALHTLEICCSVTVYPSVIVLLRCDVNKMSTKQSLFTDKVKSRRFSVTISGSGHGSRLKAH